MNTSVLWIEQSHPGIGYYDALLQPLGRHGLNVTEWRPHRHGVAFMDALKGHDVALVGFGWMSAEHGSVPRLPAFERATCATAGVLVVGAEGEGAAKGAARRSRGRRG